MPMLVSPAAAFPCPDLGLFIKMMYFCPLKQLENMVLNYIWISFILVSFAVACVRLAAEGDAQAFTDSVKIQEEEIDSYIWVDLQQARKLCTYDNDLRIIEKAETAIHLMRN